MKKVTPEWLYLTKKRSEAAMAKLSRNGPEHGSVRVPYSSFFVDTLSAASSVEPTYQKSAVSIKIPAVFSLIDNPVDSVKTILSLAAVGRTRRRIHYVNIDHSKMKKVDLASESVLDLIAIEMEREAKARKRKLSFSGFYPSEPSLKRYIRAIGIIKNLDVKHEFLSQEQENSLHIFRMRNKRLAKSVSVGSLDYKDRAVKDFVDHINDCLREIGRELLPEAIGTLSEYTSEILDNAEEHAGTDDWTIVGYFDGEHEAKLCEIAIFNVGASIADTFNALPEDSYAWNAISGYVNAHRTGGFFSADWDKDDLLTLAALQGDISTKNESGEDHRGQGTVEIIHFFQQVYRECLGFSNGCARMSVLSGSTHIFFDGKYEMKPDASGRNVIAFNTNNSLLEPPDGKYVKSLRPIRFPGTIISIRFPMQDSQTKEI
jgi:hypothetical protein